MMTHFDLKKELEFLNGLVKDYTDSSPYSEIKKEIIVNLMLGHISGPGWTGLQFGCANGYETTRLLSVLNSLEVVDGSSIFIERLKQQSHGSNLEFHCARQSTYRWSQLRAPIL